MITVIYGPLVTYCKWCQQHHYSSTSRKFQCNNLLVHLHNHCMRCNKHWHHTNYSHYKVNTYTYIHTCMIMSYAHNYSQTYTYIQIYSIHTCTYNIFIQLYLKLTRICILIWTACFIVISHHLYSYHKTCILYLPIAV